MKRRFECVQRAGRRGVMMMAAGERVRAQTVRWRASGSFPASHSTSIAMEIFKSEVARLSKNTIQVDLFPGNTLGGAFEQVDQLRTGQIQMAWGGLSFYDKLVPDLGAVGLPFSRHLGPAGDLPDRQRPRPLHRRARWPRRACCCSAGARSARATSPTTSGRSRSVEDMKGLKIRTPSGDAWTLTFRAVGANPTPIDISELYQALQQGVVDGQENPYDNMLVRKFFQVQKYVSNTAHFFDWSGYMVNKAAFEKLTPEQQKAVKRRDVHGDRDAAGDLRAREQDRPRRPDQGRDAVRRAARRPRSRSSAKRRARSMPRCASGSATR